VVATSDDVPVHEFVSPLPGELAEGDLQAGSRVTVTIDLENRLSGGRYYIHFGVTRHRNRQDVVLHIPHLLGFVVYGDRQSTGIVDTQHDMRVRLNPPGPR
jgi:hypothetical protein